MSLSISENVIGVNIAVVRVISYSAATQTGRQEGDMRDLAQFPLPGRQCNASERAFITLTRGCLFG